MFIFMFGFSLDAQVTKKTLHQVIPSDNLRQIVLDISESDTKFVPVPGTRASVEIIVEVENLDPTLLDMIFQVGENKLALDMVDGTGHATLSDRNMNNLVFVKGSEYHLRYSYIIYLPEGVSATYEN